MTRHAALKLTVNILSIFHEVAAPIAERKQRKNDAVSEISERKRAVIQEGDVYGPMFI
jgi:hypothetical protein